MIRGDSRQGAWAIDTGENPTAQTAVVRGALDDDAADPEQLGDPETFATPDAPNTPALLEADEPDDDEVPPGSARLSWRHAQTWRDLPGQTATWAGAHQSALAAAVVYLAGALIVTRHLWPHPANLLNQANPGDQIKFEWMLGEAARSFLHPHNPLFSSVLGTGGGTNLIANTSILFFGYLFAPVTLLFGAGLSYLIIITGNFVATALAWRWFFRGHVTTSEPAAFVGGLFLGFSPAMMSHALGHPNLTAQWLIPIMLHLIFRLYRSEHRVRDGMILGGLVFIQFFIAEEPLLLLGISLAVFLLGCAVFSPGLVAIHWRGMLTGGLTMVATAGVLLAYPIYFQFDGPMSFHGVPFSVPYFSQDLAGYLQFPNQSLGGSLTANVYAAGATEQAALFGGPLVILFLAICITFAYRTAVRAGLVTVVVLVALSLGPSVHSGGKPSSIPGLWTHLQNLPVFEDSLPVRMALAITPFVGYALVIIVEQVVQAPKPWRLPCYALIAAVLIPLTPRPIVAVASPPTPDFITQGAYQSCISGGRSLLTVPTDNWQPLLWTASLTNDVPMAQAPFVYPDGGPDKGAVFGTSGRTIASLLTQVENSGTVVPITPELRTAAASDFQFWSAGCVVLIQGSTNYGALNQELIALLGQPTIYNGVNVWKV